MQDIINQPSPEQLEALLESGLPAPPDWDSLANDVLSDTIGGAIAEEQPETVVSATLPDESEA
jgi:hypothetical protein